MNNMEYKFIRDGIEETVTPETWSWIAIYNDNTYIRQFAEDGTFHQFKEIDQSKLITFKMLSPNYPQIYTVPFNPESMKLIHFYRNITLNFGTPDEHKIKLYCFGYEESVRGKTVKHLMVITPSGESIMCSDPDVIEFT